MSENNTRSQRRRRYKKFIRLMERAEDLQLGNRRYSLDESRPGPETVLNQFADDVRGSPEKLKNYC